MILISKQKYRQSASGMPIFLFKVEKFVLIYV
jgi:hypothetical protein